MRPRDRRSELADVLTAGELVATFVAGRTFQDYKDHQLLSSAVERQLEIVGEALNRALRDDPALESAIPDAKRAVGLRNILAHGYDRVSDALVWSVVTESLPKLVSDVVALLDR
jgi:uncharacterized protein with HEPN domain